MKVLLHTCCAGCAIYTFKALESKFNQVTGFFFNPNIHPYKEFKSRQEAVKKYADKHRKKIEFCEYIPERFFHEVNYKEMQGERCPICWRMRLKETAAFAKEKGYDSFTTTLLISPYQDHNVIKLIGEEISKEAGITFYYEDFRPGFNESLGALKSEGLYSQKYCGCLYSEKEKYEKNEKPASTPRVEAG